ncbi:TlpA family protein disulfide reductase [Mucilaginibacter myungsuensis]|uniref:TlpA family protein disulfide reductase n=1 Tax=Mucilaginibacter myungsuensis TaxID=649104 RepID=A0A929KTT7_9SPHI|nr:TlpA disulfide reductase family protein [Mucilaginibacter myungsuensis]MBE9660662.1 TlpA family protein disulfide reductase [Mucilaginibacter myungsuensis]MDN3600707.1 TlpA disulfide reductase family protein [Mucilaginibacter myungsuensis]
MKPSIIAFLTLLAGTASAQNLNLSGTIPGIAGKKLEIKQLDHLKADIKVEADGKFSTSLTLKPGYYDLTNIDQPVFLEPGMTLDIDKGTDHTVFTGKGSAENKAIQQITQLKQKSFPLAYNRFTNEINMVEPSAFFSSVEKFKKTATTVVNKTTGSAYFKKSQTDDIKFEEQKLKMDYLPNYGIDTTMQRQLSIIQFEWIKNQRLGKVDTALTARMKKMQKDMHVKTMSAADSAKCNVLNDLNLNDAFAYQNSASYRALFQQCIINLNNAMWAKDKSVSGKAFNDKINATYITDPIIKKELEFQYVLGQFRMKRDIDKAYQEYSNSDADKNYIAEITRIYRGSKTLEGTTAPDFTYADKNGDKISLSDMKGNYVFIDFWATYCLPCIGQIPAIKDMEKRYAGKNIKFVSVSVDPKEDEAKWKKFIAENNMEGIQLSAIGSDDKFKNYFNVSGIPRFILIDPAGKVVSEDALKPADPELQKQIDALVSKN